ncbi:MAG TPA: type I methionyl aminopeptidase [Solirubrobacteraceae bacterium]|nr:type I methionyl aminopeptidase [Solirubrobacteraceae bacterium]
MSIQTPEELEHLKAAGRVVAAAIRAMRKAVAPGVTTRELDRVGARVFREAGARSGPQLDYGFPGTTCISVNDEAVHGIPGRRVLQGGDLVKLDVTAELDGFYADACVSVPVGNARRSTRALVSAAQAGLSSALRVARAGEPLNGIGRAVETTVTDRGYTVCVGLAGHGIGRRIHEAPDVLNHFVPGPSPALADGLVITIEPIISAGDGSLAQADDGWTIVTADGALSAHAEHTIVITDGHPIILTA